MKTIITGGAGFIGCNAAARALVRGDTVIVLDNLSRSGSTENLEWLCERARFEFARVDLRNATAVADLFRRHSDVRQVLHLAGQVAVTSSVLNPRADFEANALGTLNVLEAVRLFARDAALIYASTNKVYGGLEHLQIAEQDLRYAFESHPEGIAETEPLDFHSPYGCSKGAADQYVRDYHRIYGLRTVVFRQSCIYGYRQFGVEDQGWVAWFTIAAEQRRPMRVYGDGKQVRDVLFIDDLLDAFDAAFARIDSATGQVYNIGGGPGNAISLREFLAHLEARAGVPLPITYHPWRPGDQRVFISDIRRSLAELEWHPKTDWRAGVDLLRGWVVRNQALFA